MIAVYGLSCVLYHLGSNVLESNLKSRAELGTWNGLSTAQTLQGVCILVR